jgi:hypothetical protein
LLSVRALIAVLIFIRWHVILPLPCTKIERFLRPSVSIPGEDRPSPTDQGSPVRNGRNLHPPANFSGLPPNYCPAVAQFRLSMLIFPFI